MKGISKSLFASQARVRSAMADAAQASMDTLGYARGDAAAARDAEAAASAFRRGDDGACDPDASLVLVLEHAVGFDEPCLCLAARASLAPTADSRARARVRSRREGTIRIRFVRALYHTMTVSKKTGYVQTHTQTVKKRRLAATTPNLRAARTSSRGAAICASARRPGTRCSSRRTARTTRLRRTRSERKPAPHGPRSASRVGRFPWNTRCVQNARRAARAFACRYTARFSETRRTREWFTSPCVF